MARKTTVRRKAKTRTKKMTGRMKKGTSKVKRAAKKTASRLKRSPTAREFARREKKVIGATLERAGQRMQQGSRI